MVETNKIISCKYNLYKMECTCVIQTYNIDKKKTKQVYIIRNKGKY